MAGGQKVIQKNITLSPRAMAEYELVAEWLGTPGASLMRQILETHHQSPSFANLLRRARAGESPSESVKHEYGVDS